MTKNAFILTRIWAGISFKVVLPFFGPAMYSAHKPLYLTLIKDLGALQRVPKTSDHGIKLYILKMFIKNHLQLRLQLQKLFI
jgi:hypothetical protein